MSNLDRYTYRLTWSEEDEEHVGLCAEFPSFSWEILYGTLPAHNKSRLTGALRPSLKRYMLNPDQ